MQDGSVMEKILPRFQWFSRCMSSIQSIQFVISGLPPTFYWADNFLFDLGKANAS